MTAFSFGPALLFCPADRPDRYQKAVERADAVIIDLEDAVRPTRARARDALVASGLDPSRVIVRINPLDSDDAGADLEAVSQHRISHGHGAESRIRREHRRAHR